jgi:hypothetical protein
MCQIRNCLGVLGEGFLFFLTLLLPFYKKNTQYLIHYKFLFALNLDILYLFIFLVLILVKKKIFFEHSYMDLEHIGL